MTLTGQQLRPNTVPIDRTRLAEEFRLRGDTIKSAAVAIGVARTYLGSLLDQGYCTLAMWQRIESYLLAVKPKYLTAERSTAQHQWETDISELASSEHGRKTLRAIARAIMSAADRAESRAD